MWMCILVIESFGRAAAKNPPDFHPPLGFSSATFEMIVTIMCDSFNHSNCNTEAVRTIYQIKKVKQSHTHPRGGGAGRLAIRFGLGQN